MADTDPPVSCSPDSTRIDPQDITGVVLAGGRGSRMGGVDKGLQLHHGEPLALHALRRLRPQVGAAMISANRNLVAYEAMGVPVWPDTVEGYAGPLAGVLTALQHARTAWIVTVPCDSPRFPVDLVARLAHAAASKGANIAMAATTEGDLVRRQPVFSLIRCDLLESLTAYLTTGERKFDRWASLQQNVWVPFADGLAFFNANTPDDLKRLGN